MGDGVDKKDTGACWEYHTLVISNAFVEIYECVFHVAVFIRQLGLEVRAHETNIASAVSKHIWV